MLKEFRRIIRITVIVCMGLLYTVTGHANQINNWPEVGRAELSVLWFDVYDAVFSTPTGRFVSFSAPSQLRLEYKRNFTKSELIKETGKQLKRFDNDRQQREQWLSELNQIWPDVAEGDRLVFQITENGQGEFFYNAQWIGGVSDPSFASAFIQIWLSDNGQYPRLAAKLKGLSKATTE